MLDVSLAPDVPPLDPDLARNFYTTSSCGLCGKASIEAVAVQGRFELHGADFSIDRRALGPLPEALQREQAVFEQTGAGELGREFSWRRHPLNYAVSVATVRRGLGARNAGTWVAFFTLNNRSASR